MKRAILIRQRGFSLVELMVSVVIGLLALLFAVNMVGGAEKTRGNALGGSDGMQNGMVALFALGNDANTAGFGLNDPIIAGCNTQFKDAGGFQLAPFQPSGSTTTLTPLAPVIIESNGADPDRITFYSGASPGGTPSWGLLANYTAGGTQLSLDHPSYAMQQYDVLLVAPDQPGNDCLLLQRSDAAPMATTVRVESGGDTRFNAVGTRNASFTLYKSRVFDLGPARSLSFRSWSVSGGYLQMQSLAGDTPGQAATVANDIVSIKAQYGFDTRTANAFHPETGLQVGQWSSAMIDADGSGVTGDAGDWQHIAAVRIAVVARSKAAERPAAGATCTTTPLAKQPTVFTTAPLTNVAAAPVTVNVAVAGDPLDWKCYSYQSFETIVTLRNGGWRRIPQ